MRVRVLIRPKAGILDPQGQTVERALPALGFEGVRNVHVGRLVELDVRGRLACPGDVREAARESLDRGLRDPVRFGVVRFPGSCDEVDALLAASPGRRGRAVVACRRRSARRRRRDHPRRVLLRRPPAGGRDRALLAGDGRGRALRPPRRARARASATASRCCARPGCCRARCCPTRPEVHLPAGRRWRSSTRATAWTGACERSARRCRSRPSTRPGATTRPIRCSTSSRPTARSSCATRAGENFNGSARDIAGVSNAAGNVVGLMPHPEHAVDVLTGSADGLKLFESAARSARHEQASRARAHRLRVRPDRREAGARAERGRARRLLADVVRALRLQALAAAAEDAADRGAAAGHGPGRERGRGRRSATGWRARSRSSRTTTRARSSPSRAPRPASAASCATSSRSARGRSRSWTRCASARWRRPRGRATCSSARSRASATTATRSGSPPSAARSTSRARTSRTAWSTRWRWG